MGPSRAGLLLSSLGHWTECQDTAGVRSTGGEWRWADFRFISPTCQLCDLGAKYRLTELLSFLPSVSMKLPGEVGVGMRVRFRVWHVTRCLIHTVCQLSTVSAPACSSGCILRIWWECVGAGSGFCWLAEMGVAQGHFLFSLYKCLCSEVDSRDTVFPRK